MSVAITGGIGSGKSYVCRLLKQRGIEIYDCDAAAKRLMRESDDLKKRLQALVGEEVYTDGELNKVVMAKYLLSSEEHARAVDNVVHPAVADDFIRSGMTWMECAILFESGFQRLVDQVVRVVAPLEVRIRRVMERDGISREKVLEWMTRQWPQEEVLRQSDLWILNDGKENLNSQIDNLINFIKE